ncbi:MAG: transcription termination factor NusA [bacterium]
MNAAELKAFMRQISKEKELDINVVREAIEQALVSASKKNLSQFIDAHVQLDADTGQLHLFVKKNVVSLATSIRTEISLREARKHQPGVKVGDVIEVEIDPENFGRIAAQSARQFVMQKLRDAERLKIYDEYKVRIGEIVSAIVLRFEKRDLVLSVGRTEALLRRNDAPPTSHYRVGDRLKVYVTEVDPNAKGPILHVSRNHSNLVVKLFEQEVPEVADGTVKIIKVVRDPGSRSKIAVESVNPNVDPVGACVGVKGARVQMIVRELENEKIDIVPFNANPRHFITSALVPAQIQSINIDEEKRAAEIFVKTGNLSLAIGKKGQNARLAAKLTGWKLTIHSEDEEQKLSKINHVEIQRKYLDDFLDQLEKIGDDLRERIRRSPYTTVQSIATANMYEFAGPIGNNVDLAEEIIEDAKEYVEALREMTQTEYGGEAATEPDEEDNAAAKPQTNNAVPDESSEQTGNAEPKTES